LESPHTNEEIDSFLDEYVEQNDLTDVLFIRPLEGDKADLLPIQIKRFGLGEESKGDTETFINSLKKYLNLPKNENGLVINLEPTGNTVDLKEVTEWLRGVSFPFREVALVASQGGKITFCQVKPVEESFRCVSYPTKEITKL